MRLEKGMKLTQKKKFDTHLGVPCTFNLMREEAWYICDITKKHNKILYHLTFDDHLPFIIIVDEDTLKIFFTPWTKWKHSPDGFDYRTNGRIVTVRKKVSNRIDDAYITAKATCHKLDKFDLETGIDIALKRLEFQMALSDIEQTTKVLDNTNQYTSTVIIGVGSIFGPLEVIAYKGQDCSRHNLWECRCTKCGRVVTMRSTNLRKVTGEFCRHCANTSIRITNKILNNPAKVWGNVENTCKATDDNVIKFEKEFLWARNNFTLKETTGELLESPCYNYIVHALSADYATNGAIGTTKKIIDMFNIHSDVIDELDYLEKVEQYYNDEEVVGSIIFYPKNVISLITKNNRYDTVTYNTVARVLKNLKKAVITQEIKYISMPRICCGKDKLDWEVVREMIIDTFKDIKHELIITVYHK